MPGARTTCICCRSARSSKHGLARRVQPRDAVGRADREADLRIEGRYRGHLPARQEVRLRRQDVQEHQGREQRAGRRGHPARNEPRQLVDRLLRPVAGAAQGAHGESGGVRPGDPARAEGRPDGATTTVCRGRAGVRPRSSIRARRCSTTPPRASWTAAARSARASASSARRSGRRHDRQGQPAGRRILLQGFRRSRTAIRSSPTAC